jgi:hypothetical protein
MRCQTQAMADSTEELSLGDRSRLRWVKLHHYLWSNIKKVIADPMIIRRKLGLKFSSLKTGQTSCSTAAGVEAKPKKTFPPLDLKAGERVRVKSLEEIKKTLDHDGRCEGLGFMDLVMEPFCDQSFTVRKQIGLFFDERNWRMQKLRKVVILDEVYCELPVQNKALEWAGCDRTCFLFWKEAWLERLGPDGPAT